MKNLTKESILKAIQRIDENPELIKHRESFLYDLLYQSKKYPPILVLSEANILLGGKELLLSDFGNDAKKAFKVLEKFGFKVIQKTKNNVNVWFVCQGETFTEDRGKKFLWAPKRNKAGRKQFYWENMKKVQKGDLIFNYSKGLKGISIAKTDYYESNNAEQQSTWGKEGYKVDIDLYEFDRTIHIEELKKMQIEFDLALQIVNKSPFDINGDVKQGYLFEFTPEAGKIILDIYGKEVGNEIIDKFFNNIDTPANIDTSEKPQKNSKNYFDCSEFNRTLINSGLLFSPKLTTRFISSLLTKPFVILTGLSGSGKTKLAQAFTRWICQDENQYCVVPVGADWTNREPLLGYPNALKPDEYVKPDNGVLDLIIRANKNSSLPYFLILDEMNLSHVERYFADFLSVMESNEEIPLFAEGAVNNGVPAKLNLSDNLFIIGTVNIDETTYMFSPKVLDRANTIEFRVNEDEIEYFLNNQY